MNITANRMELLAAVESADRIAPAASPLDILKCVCLETENGKLTVAATNQEIAMERRLPADILENGRLPSTRKRWRKCSVFSAATPLRLNKLTRRTPRRASLCLSKAERRNIAFPR